MGNFNNRGTYKVEEVPKLLNLQECVSEVLKEVGVEGTQAI